MPFLSFSNTNVNFKAKGLNWRSYTTGESLRITNLVKLIDKREFAKATLDDNSKTYIVHIAALEAIEANGRKIHFS